MSRLLGNFSLQTAALKQSVPIINYMVGINLGFFAMYKLSSGPVQMRFKKYFSTDPSHSSVFSVFTSLCPTTFWQAASSTAVLGTLGRYYAITLG